ncbi:MAG TPA: LON peptidase substrate-binding domain-containing protein [Terriglobales bacterium]|nr:LON peptidase substrate-binding domain-containing protein [Terriglobales bacterium]
MSSLIALFPLDVVLFPSAPLPLHIFEPRYKEMIGECMAAKRSFGVVRSQGETLAEVGCTAEILEVTKKYEDGRLDILTQGRQRFELVGLNQDRAFLQAEVTYFDDELGATEKHEIERAIRLYHEVVEVAGVEAPSPMPGAGELSYQLVAPLPLDLDFKQTLLGMRSEPQRVSAVIEYYQALLPRMRRSIQVRRVAGGNGHAI